MTRFDTMMAQYPPFLRRDPTLRAINHAAAQELDLLEEKMDELMSNFTPQNADAFLHFWEVLFQLPANPPGKTLEQRRQSVVTFLRRLAGGLGENWVQRVNDLLDGGWRYAVHTPQGIRGLLWDRFFDIDADWVMDTAPSGNIEVLDPAGWSWIGQLVAHRSDVTQEDQESMVQFEVGPAHGDIEIGVRLKVLENGDYLHVRWHDEKVEISDVVGGVATVLAEDAEPIPLEEGKRYWICGRIVGDEVEASIWKSDPTKNNGDTPIGGAAHTLNAARTEKYATGIVVPTGISGYLLDGWWIRQFRFNEAGLNIPENTLRVTIPYEEESYRAVEVARLLRDITPANTAIEVFFDSGFILGKSLLGVQGL